MAAFGAVGNFGAWGSNTRAHRACRDYRKLWKGMLQGLCVLRVHANYVSVKRAGVGHGGF